MMRDQHQNVALRLWTIVEEALGVHGLRAGHVASILRLMAEDVEAGLVRPERPAGTPTLVAVPTPRPEV